MSGKRRPMASGDAAGRGNADTDDEPVAVAAVAAATPGSGQGEGDGSTAGRPDREDAGRGGQAMIQVCRSARLTPAAYRFYRAILLAFVASGHAPEPAAVAALARQFGVRHAATLARMAAQDLVQRDPQTGRIRAAYPFSGVPTPHRVALFADHSGERTDRIEVRVFAMCALDALGIPLMLRRAAVITSADALTGEPLSILVRPVADPRFLPLVNPLVDWRVSWEPDSIAVYTRPEEHEAEHDAGDCVAAGTCCPVTNFFAARANAHAWVGQQSEPAALDGLIVGQDAALERAHALFAGVLDRLVEAGASA